MQTLSNVSSYFSAAVDAVENTCVRVYQAAQPYLGVVADKVQWLWEKSLPYLETFVEFSSTRFGFAVDLAALSAVPFAISGCTHSKVATVAFVAAGALMLGASAYLFSGLPLPEMISSLFTAPVV